MGDGLHHEYHSMDVCEGVGWRKEKPLTIDVKRKQ